MQRPTNPESAARLARHVRAPVPLVFRSEASVPESKRHLELRTLLYLVLKRRFAATATIGSEQFVYFRAHTRLAAERLIEELEALLAATKLAQPTGNCGAW